MKRAASAMSPADIIGKRLGHPLIVHVSSDTRDLAFRFSPYSVESVPDASFLLYCALVRLSVFPWSLCLNHIVTSAGTLGSCR